MKANLFIITGVSGSGKSTIIEPLRSLLGAGFELHDFDERGVPDNVNPSWAENETKYWEEIARANAERRIITVLCGFVFPTHITKSDQTCLVLLDLTEQDLRDRLTSRYVNPENITELKRMTGHSPDEFIAGQIKGIPWLKRLTQEFGGTIIDTSGLTPDEVAQRVHGYILA